MVVLQVFFFFAHNINNMPQLENPNPTIYEVTAARRPQRENNLDENVEDAIDAWEVFEHIRNINDPEHPNTLEQLKVANLEGTPST